ncbi:OTU deubiquitinase with linear linkage specificity b isoform X2 [Engraulis encrasicolus]|uniref:OTU deubiquitinase with linear linkage specificity b isoform X2 n=1 Tax=Engraulis encrasicolus TaxID=184585 RepID=UPI002FCEDF1B
MGNCCRAQTQNNLEYGDGLPKVKIKNHCVNAKSDGKPEAKTVERRESNTLQNDSVTTCKGNDAYPVDVRTMPRPGGKSPNSFRGSAKSDRSLQKSTVGLQSTSPSGCQGEYQPKRVKKQASRHGDDPHVNCSQLKAANAVESREKAVEQNNERLARLGGTMERRTRPTTETPSTTQDKATEQIGSGEHKPPLSPRVPEEDKSEDDLYRGEDEIEQERIAKASSEEHTFPGSQPLLSSKDQYSVEDPVDLMTYSQREWRGNTAKSVLIRKGYEKISHEFSQLRRVRGDNYCALRATLFQLLSQSTQLPKWIAGHDMSLLPKKLPLDLVDQWTFPFENQGSSKGAVEQLGHYLKLLKKRWQEAVEARGPEREKLCKAVFQGGEEEYGLLEALKFLMLWKAVELHGASDRGDAVPEFCWLLFARDSSRCPKTLLTNHLRHVGFSGGLEQVEMFLLGYSLQQTIQVHRLYKMDTEEFITYYPDDHKQDWPHLCLLTEDDRHYNVPVPKTPRAKANSSGPSWRVPSGTTAMHGHSSNKTGQSKK